MDAAKYIPYNHFMKENDIKREIIGFFRENQDKYFSGEDLSRHLGFSRASVWKYISKLRDDGYEIDAVPHLGYKLVSSPDKLFPFEISRGLSTDIFGRGSIFYYDSIGSTNNKAYELAEGGEAEGALVVAETQTKGKGRIGRKWVSPGGGGIYFSLILRPVLETDQIPTITLMAGASIVRAVKKVTGVNALMKWPNDVLIDGKKVSGVLTEIKAQPDRVDFIVLGIGINVNTSGKKLPPEGTSLTAASGKEVDRLELLRALLVEIERHYKKIRDKGFVSIRDEYKSLSSVLGKKVKVQEHQRTLEGTAVDVDEKGALIVKDRSGGLKRVFSGDVLLCR